MKSYEKRRREKLSKLDVKLSTLFACDAGLVRDLDFGVLARVGKKACFAMTLVLAGELELWSMRWDEQSLRIGSFHSFDTFIQVDNFSEVEHSQENKFSSRAKRGG